MGKKISARRPPACPETDAVADVYAPPAFDWWTRPGLCGEERGPEPAAAGEAGEAVPASGLRLGTFHRALGRDDDPAAVEARIRAGLAQRRGAHDAANLARRAAAAEGAAGVRVLVVELGRWPGARPAECGRVVRGRVDVGIFEARRPLGALRRRLVRRGARVLWEGRGPGSLAGFRVVRYAAGDTEAGAELFFYKSALAKALGRGA